ncbi:TraR/DksA family transcriptional regulator [Georgenia yuyongxinii]|uniref:TraR/DksA family transcriptional regulator n=1 Tax=Georgenia yuyongxinii TaxID=2589797 RepID=A0A5B8C1Q9_9MICO|nr:TraR/DksA C4-type zinc finger protein [Georgenia yuyongxinii]QDC24047.1 TraR/DksA family transcriptional regulator [Georgenia yuyongxinii]
MADEGDTAAARARLEEVRAAARARLAALDRSFDDVVAAADGANTDDEHDPEGATIGFERAQVTALAEQSRQSLADADAALARLGAGSYGRCARCGRDIPAARLAVRPTATMCVECAGRR